jgi:hypothetical protein
MFVLIGGLFLCGCQKTIYIQERQIRSIQVCEKLPSRVQPAQFYICGNAKYLCYQSHNRFTSSNQLKRKPYEKLDYKQTCVK